MQKQTLAFPSFRELSTFVKPLTIGYLINTNTLTITARFPEAEINEAIDKFNARLMEANEKAYSYE